MQRLAFVNLTTQETRVTDTPPVLREKYLGGVLTKLAEVGLQHRIGTDSCSCKWLLTAAQHRGTSDRRILASAVRLQQPA